MTAHTRCSRVTEWGVLSLEIQSVNRRHLEVSTTLPKEFISLDPEIKKTIQNRINRGKISLYLSFTPSETESSICIQPDLRLAKDIQRSWNLVCDTLNITQRESGLMQLLVREPKLFQSEVSMSFLEAITSELVQLLNEALSHLIEMRQKEGAFLENELLKHLQKIAQLTQSGQNKSKNFAQKHHVQLQERLQLLLDEVTYRDERVLKEVALIADKSDITEEFARIFSHIELFESVLKKQDQSIGKTLDFIAQELNREWNTIASKTNDLEVSHLAIEAKSECEKIREQVQNIE